MNDRPDFGEYEFQLFNTNQPMEKPETVLSVKHANRAFDEWLKKQKIVYGFTRMNEHTGYASKNYDTTWETHKARLICVEQIKD